MWLEISWDDGFFDRLVRSKSYENWMLQGAEGDVNDLDDVCQHMQTATREAFWFPQLSLVAVPVSEDQLFGAIAANARTLRDVYLEGIEVKGSLIGRLAELPGLKLSSMRVKADSARILCHCALLRYINREAPVQYFDCNCGWNLSWNFIGNRNSQVRDMVAWESKQWATEVEFEPCSEPRSRGFSPGPEQSSSTARTRRDSVDSEASSEDDINRRRRSCPKWAWGRFFVDDNQEPSIFYYQVPDSDPHGYPTKCWRFTLRNGEVGYGDEPLEFFDEWDPDAGDREEPTPYCRELQIFNAHENDVYWIKKCVQAFFGRAAWDVLRNLSPPAGATEYNSVIDPVEWE